MSDLAQVISLDSVRVRRVARESERWVRKATVAEHFDVSVRTVSRWMARGMPFDPGPWDGAHPRFKLSVVEAWRHGS